MLEDSVKNCAHLHAACMLSTHELRGQLNYLLVVSFSSVVKITSCVYTRFRYFRKFTVFFLQTRRSKIVSRAVARRAATSVDNEAVLKITCVICTC